MGRADSVSTPQYKPPSPRAGRQAVSVQSVVQYGLEQGLRRAVCRWRELRFLGQQQAVDLQTVLANWRFSTRADKGPKIALEELSDTGRQARSRILRQPQNLLPEPQLHPIKQNEAQYQLQVRGGRPVAGLRRARQGPHRAPLLGQCGAHSQTRGLLGPAAADQRSAGGARGLGG